MKITELIDRNKIFNLALILLAFIISHNIIYKKQTKEEQFLKQKINEETKKNEVLENIGKKEGTINAYKNLLPKKDANVIINTLNSIAKAPDIKITSIKPAQEQRNPNYIKLPFNLMLTASNYHALGKYISKIESSQDVYIVESLNINSKREEQGLTVNLTISYIAFTPLEK